MYAEVNYVYKSESCILEQIAQILVEKKAVKRDFSSSAVLAAGDFVFWEV